VPEQIGLGVRRIDDIHAGDFENRIQGLAHAAVRREELRCPQRAVPVGQVDR
jgi:hypothetical protein